MKKLLTLLALIPILVFGQTTPTIKQVLSAGNNATGKSLIGTALVGLNGATSGTVSIMPPAIVTTYTFTLPPNDGTSGQVLQTDGAGVATWVTASSGITVGSTAIASGTSGAIPFNSAGVYGEDATQLFWDNTNNRLGIGTNAPASLLQTLGTGVASANYDLQVKLSGHSASSAYLGYLADGSGCIVLENAAHTYNVFSINNGFSDVGYDYVKTGRNFGIGQLGIAWTPSYLFHVDGSAATNYCILSKNNVNQSVLGYNASGGYFGLNNSAGSTEIVKFDGSGHNWINTGQRLGIGTVTPDYKVHINSTVATYDWLKFSKSGVQQIYMGYDANGGNILSYLLDGTTEAFNFNSQFYTLDFINTGRNFGIGITSASSAKLHVKGSGATSATYTTLFENSAGTDALQISDDLRSLFSGRIEGNQGTDVASAVGAIALGYGGNTFEITGTSAITLISNLGWQNGSEVDLVFTSTASLTDGTANSGTDIGMELSGGANFTGSADDIITLKLCEVGGTQRWREVSRSVN